MALEIQFYQSVSWNTGDDTSPVGGAIDASTVVLSTLNGVFPEGVSDYIGQDARLRFQKVFVKNTGADITSPQIFLNDIKHPGQIQIATGSSLSTDSGIDPTGYPGDLSSSDFFEPIGVVNATGVGLSTLDSGSAFGLWIKQSIPSNLPSEVGASATIAVIGEV